MELGSKGHCVDDDRFFVWVTIEDDDLQQRAGAIRTDRPMPLPTDLSPPTVLAEVRRNFRTSPTRKDFSAVTPPGRAPKEER